MTWIGCLEPETKINKTRIEAIHKAVDEYFKGGMEMEKIDHSARRLKKK